MSWTKTLYFTIKQRGRVLCGKPVSMIIIIKASKSKKQFPTWSQNWLSPCSSIFYEHSYKNQHHNTLNPGLYSKKIIYCKVWFISSIQYSKISVINHINRLKKGTYLNILSQKNVTHIYGKNSEQIRNRDFLKLMNNIHKNPTANVIISCEKLNAFLPRLGERQRCTLPLLLFNIALKVIGSAIR